MKKMKYTVVFFLFFQNWMKKMKVNIFNSKITERPNNKSIVKGPKRKNKYLGDQNKTNKLS
jgi:hypothetical protein